MNALDFRIGNPEPIVPGEADVPVAQTIHMRREAALRMAEKLREWAFSTPAGGWVEMNVVGYRLVPTALEGLIVRGNG